MNMEYRGSQCFKKLADKAGIELSAIYPDSIYELDGTVLFMMKRQYDKKLVAVGGRSPIFSELDGVQQSTDDFEFKTCDLTVQNSKVIREYFPFTNPIPLLGSEASLGLGDRLGVAGPGHVRLLKNSGIRPVLAQQSIRELRLTGRDYAEVLADAVWAVFQEDYRRGFGADGDHLKTVDEVRLALENDYTMITLDCSEYIVDLSHKSEDEVGTMYLEFDEAERIRLESYFLGRSFAVGDMSISFAEDVLMRNVVIYQKAIDFVIEVFSEAIEPVGRKIDFEISIDETVTPTDPLSHFFVARQLIDAGVQIDSVAPRFCGEFQKGIDYIGDVEEFDREFTQHVSIAENLGYKLSIHSGSDKFRVFPIIGRRTKGQFHVKTAGTNWLEAVRVIIDAEPELYREMHTFAFKHLDEARAYYHVKAEPANIPDVSKLSNEELGTLMEQDDARQVLHITYGLILQAKDEDGNSVFRDRIYKCLHENEELYYKFLERHIGKHLERLGIL